VNALAFGRLGRQMRGGQQLHQLRVLARYPGWITLADPEGNEFCIHRAGVVTS
jgi:hypothetical protein